MTRQEALQSIARAAVAATRGTDCPAELVAAQAIIESGWLEHSPGNNCFGIKARQGDHDRQLLRTAEWFTDAEREAFLRGAEGRTAELVTPPEADRRGRKKYRCQDWFAVFPALADCFARRVLLFSIGRYAPIALEYRETGDLEQLVRKMAAVYATDPNYAPTILQFIRRPDLTAALEAARRNS
jgi:flagellum-specific peptidoglycan hydrolase FlgJ